MKKNVHNGHSQQRRHKCSICGRVRFESKMRQIEYESGMPMRTRFGNQCWVCVDNPECLHKERYFHVH